MEREDAQLRFHRAWTRGHEMKYQVLKYQSSSFPYTGRGPGNLDFTCLPRQSWDHSLGGRGEENHTGLGSSLLCSPANTAQGRTPEQSYGTYMTAPATSHRLACDKLPNSHHPTG